MIRFEKSTELDIAIKNLERSMAEMNEYTTAILNYIDKPLTPHKEKELIEVLKNYKVPHDCLKYDIKVLTDNPYFRDIKLNNIAYKTVRYEKSTIKKRTLISMNFQQPVGKYLFCRYPIGYFEKDIILSVLKEGNKVWMSPAISEIESMREGIKKGCGKCLTMGLGIGVLPYLWLLKDEVESVTVIEHNNDVIHLFETYIRPQFKTDKKLKVIRGNAFDYYNEEFLKQFDYVYVDFWESSEAGLELYTRLLEKELLVLHVDYWAEESILYNVKYITSLYLCVIYKEQNATKLIPAMNDDFKLIKKVDRYFKANNNVIKTEKELLEIIHEKKVMREILSYRNYH